MREGSREVDSTPVSGVFLLFTHVREGEGGGPRTFAMEGTGRSAGGGLSLTQSGWSGHLPSVRGGSREGLM